MKVLVPHGTTVTGFGIGQIESGLFALSPCCGFAMNPDDGCLNCGETYNKYQDEENINVTGFMPLDNSFLEVWATRLIGQPAKIRIER